MDLSYNRIRHVTDMVDGWNLTVDEFKTMMYTGDGTRRRRAAMLDVDVDGNLLDCNCDDYELYRLEKGSYKYSHTYKDARCRTPGELRNQTIREISLNEFVCDVTTGLDTTFQQHFAERGGG